MSTVRTKRLDDAALAQRVAQRFVRARLLNGLSQEDAARQLGYRTSAPLSKIEGCKAPVPRSLLPHAAVVYSVSTDFLLGLSDYPDRDPRRVEQVAALRHVEHLLTENARTVAIVALEAANSAVPLRLHLSAVLGSAEQCVAMVARLRELNAKFDEKVRGGGNLLNATLALSQCVEHAQAYMMRYRNEQLKGRAGETTRSLFDDIDGNEIDIRMPGAAKAAHSEVAS